MTVEYKSRSYGICWLFTFIRSEVIPFRWSFHTDLCFQSRHDFNMQVPIPDNTDQTDCRLWKFLWRKGWTIIWKLFMTRNSKQYSFAFMEIELSSFCPFMSRNLSQDFQILQFWNFSCFFRNGWFQVHLTFIWFSVFQKTITEILLVMKLFICCIEKILRFHLSCIK